MSNTFLRACTALAVTALGGCMQAPPSTPAIAPGAKYVAMGSSYAAGPGIATYVDATPGPCFRSDTNYAHQIARRKGLALTDVSCGGAVTRHLTGPRDAIPPQLDAVDTATRLVTITIGGNDLNYIGRLTSASCAGVAQQTGSGGDKCNSIPPPPTEQDYAGLAVRMDGIAKEVRRRAPSARLVFVDYLAVLPTAGVCPATPLSAAEADADREIARRLAAITAKAAAENGADVLKASKLSQGHDACATDPWMNGYPRPGAPVAGATLPSQCQGHDRDRGRAGKAALGLLGACAAPPCEGDAAAARRDRRLDEGIPIALQQIRAASNLLAKIPAGGPWYEIRR